jgi:hypothetical protein
MAIEVVDDARDDGVDGVMTVTEHDDQPLVLHIIIIIIIIIVIIIS